MAPGEWDWVAEGPGWEGPQPTQPPGVAPWDMPEPAYAAPQPDYSGSPVPEAALEENGRYGVPIASGGVLPPAEVEAAAPPPPTPEQLATPPMPSGAMPPGIKSMSASYSGTGPYQAAGPAEISDAPSAEAMMAPQMAAHQAEMQTAQAAYAANQGQADLDQMVSDERDQVNREEDTNRAVATAMKAQAEKQADERVEAARQQVKTINPGRRFANMSIFGKTVGAMAAAITGYYAPYNGGKNSVIDTMLQLTDQDIRAQEDDQKAALAGVDTAQRQGEQAIDNAQTNIRNVHFQRASRLEAVADHFGEEAAKVKSQFNAANLLKARDTAMQAAADEYVKSKQLEAAQILARDTLRIETQQKVADRNQRAAEFSRRLAYDSQNDAANRAAKDAAPPAPVLISAATQKKYTIDPARYGNPSKPAITPAQLAKTDASWQANADVGAVVRELFDRSTELGATYQGVLSNRRGLSSQDKLVAKSLHDYLVANVLHKYSGAAATDAERQQYKEMLGDPESWTQEGPGPRLRSFMERISHEQGSIGNSLGLRDEEGKKYDPKNEFFIPEMKTEGPKNNAASLETIRNATPDTAGPDTKAAIVAEAKARVDSLDRLTPAQIHDAFALTMQKAIEFGEAGDKKTAASLAAIAKKYELKLKTRELLNTPASPLGGLPKPPGLSGSGEPLFPSTGTLQDPWVVDEALKGVRGQ